MSRRLWTWLSLVLLLGLPTLAAAHETTRSYVSITREEGDLQLHARVAFQDIDAVVWLDENLDGRITWGEARRRLPEIHAYFQASFSLSAGGDCMLRPTGATIAETDGAPLLELRLSADCPDPTALLKVRSQMFELIDPAHRQFVQVDLGGTAASAVLGPSAPEAVFADDALWATFEDYFRSGVAHLLGGADHLAFLIVLMLPAICAASGATRAALGVVSAVTGFTVAHAITLFAATSDVLRPPPDIIEALIALSILVTAVDNVRPFLPASRTAVAAFFGLFHGFGFAGALGALDLSGGAFVVALLGFNLGIEAAQIGIVLVTLPALYMLGSGRGLLWVGSGLSAVAAAAWFGDRVWRMLV